MPTEPELRALLESKIRDLVEDLGTLTVSPAISDFVAPSGPVAELALREVRLTPTHAYVALDLNCSGGRCLNELDGEFSCDWLNNGGVHYETGLGMCIFDSPPPVCRGQFSELLKDRGPHNQDLCAGNPELPPQCADASMYHRREGPDACVTFRYAPSVTYSQRRR